MSDSSIYREVLLEYENLKNNARMLYEHKKDVCYNRCHQIKEIDDEINMIGLKITRAVINATKVDKSKYIYEIKKTLENLKLKREKILLENGFSLNYFEDIYVCPKCKDTGFIENEKCECFKQKLIEKAYNMSNLSKSSLNESFLDLNFDYYSKEIEKGRNISAHKNMQFIIRRCYFFIENFGVEYKNMVFYGGVGLGKTYVCRCIAKEILNKGHTVLYVSAFDLFNMFEKEKFNKDEVEPNNKILKYVKTADLLIIDDLGTEFSTSLSNAELFDIINSRFLNQKATIISTNLSPEYLTEMYSSRVMSRLYGHYEILEFFGEDIRLNKSVEKLGEKIEIDE